MEFPSTGCQIVQNCQRAYAIHLENSFLDVNLDLNLSPLCRGLHVAATGIFMILEVACRTKLNQFIIFFLYF